MINMPQAQFQTQPQYTACESWHLTTSSKFYLSPVKQWPFRISVSRRIRFFFILYNWLAVELCSTKWRKILLNNNIISSSFASLRSHLVACSDPNASSGCNISNLSSYYFLSSSSDCNSRYIIGCISLPFRNIVWRSTFNPCCLIHFI